MNVKADMVAGIKLVIFDFDGTLIDAYQAVDESVNYTLQQLDYPRVSAYKIKRSVGWGEVNLIATFVRPKDLPRAVKIYRRHHPAALRRGTKLLPGAKTLLKYLKRKKYLVAIASNRATKFTKIIARHLAIDSCLDFILCRDKVARPKPFPDILNGILLHFSLKPEEAIFVGDMIVDIQAGRRAKIKSVAVVTGSSTRKELLAQKPGHLIKRIAEIKALLPEK